MLARHIGVGAVPLILAIAASEATAPYQATQRPPPTHGTLYADQGAPPTSFEELWQFADLVVRGRVEATTLRRSNARKRAVPLTEHRLRVLEVLKQAGASDIAGQTIAVVQVAGSLDIDGMHITVDAGRLLVLAAKQEALLFLKKNEQESAFAIIFGNAGLYVLGEEHVAIPEESSKAVRALFNGKSTVSRSEFLAVLKARASEKGAGR